MEDAFTPAQKVEEVVNQTACTQKEAENAIQASKGDLIDAIMWIYSGCRSVAGIVHAQYPCDKNYHFEK